MASDYVRFHLIMFNFGLLFLHSTPCPKAKCATLIGWYDNNSDIWAIEIVFYILCTSAHLISCSFKIGVITDKWKKNDEIT